MSISAKDLEAYEVQSQFLKDGNIVLEAQRHISKYYKGDKFVAKVDSKLAKLCLYPFPGHGPACVELDPAQVGYREGTVPGVGNGVAYKAKK